MMLKKINQFISADGWIIIGFCLFGILKREDAVIGQGALPLVCKTLYYFCFAGLLLRAGLKIKKEGIKLKKDYFKIFIPLLLLYIFSEVIALVANPDYALKYGTSSILSSCEVVVNFVATIVSILCMCILEKEKSIKYLTIGYLINQIVVLTWGFVTFGFGPAIADLFSGFGIGTSPKSIFEIHSATYCLGLLILYYLFSTKGKRPVRLLALLIFFFISGQKRIALVALIVAVIFGFFLNKIKLTKRKIIIFGLILGIAIFVYVALLYNGLFFNLPKQFGINPSGRQFLYKYFTNRTTFSIAQLPWGLDTVNSILANTPYTEIHISYIAVALHGDLLRNFIEFGFIGYMIWGALMVYYIPNKIYTILGEKSTKSYMICAVYVMILYAVSNAYYLSPVMLLLFIIPIGAYYEHKHHKPKKGDGLEQEDKIGKSIDT